MTPTCLDCATTLSDGFDERWPVCDTCSKKHPEAKKKYLASQRQRLQKIYVPLVGIALALVSVFCIAAI